MSTNIKYLTILTLCLCFFVGQSFKRYDLVKNISKEFELRNDGTLDIYNKYGKVKIMTWSKEQTTIDVEIKVDARSERRAQEMLDRINVEFSNKPSYVSAKTVFKEDKRKSYQMNYNSSFEINYTIYMPENAFLKVFNKYGNTKVEALNRDVDAEIKYGDIDMETVRGDVTLRLGYGNANLKEMNNLEATVKYSKGYFGDMKDLKMESKYSQFVFGNMQDAIIESKYDHYKINEVNIFKNYGKYDDFRIKSAVDVHFETKYTEIDIDFLGKGMNVDQKYGDVKISELGSGAEYLNFDLEYTDVIVRRVNSGYIIDLESDYTDLDVPNDFKITDLRSDLDDCCERDLSGELGNGQVKIKANLRYGELKIM